MVFQDPYGSLDPRQTIERIVCEPLAAQGGAPRAEQHRRAAEVLESVGLRTSDLGKYPHEFSGGQRQRIAIARALITRPRLIVADEPVSALDVSVQAQVLDLLREIKRDTGLTYLFISHNLGVVREISDTIIVMKAGKIVERGTTADVLTKPAEPYTKALRAAALDPTTMVGVKPRHVLKGVA
jgi:peptide/nickel transport system ATP-binding protein